MYDVRILNVGPIIPAPPMRLPITKAERHANALAAKIVPEILKGDLTVDMVVDSLIMAYNFGYDAGKLEAQRVTV